MVAITALATTRGSISDVQAAAMVGGGILTLLLYPAIASKILRRDLPA